ncbi:MAG: hypothetical protein H6Q13_1652 [Bacteroidetes bacterium]|nr:hypothetical protein [Bacteroidota bacterium]
MKDFSNDDLNYFLQFYGLDNRENVASDPVLKRNILASFKNRDAIMKKWSLDLFADFSYHVYPKRPRKDQNSSILLDQYRSPNFPLSQTSEEIKLNIIPSDEQHCSKKSNKSSKKPDYEAKNRTAKKLGDRGEVIVLDFEKNRLKKIGMHKQAKMVERISLKTDCSGYDILSFNEDGTERYIEVKATQAKVGQANFYLTINELNTAKEKPNYYIYMVFDILSIKPQIWIIDNPFYPENPDIQMKPINFKVKINAS